MYGLRTNMIIFHVFTVLACSVECDFVFANNNGEVIRCLEREREALLKFKEGLIDKYGMLSSWEKGNRECCKWEGVRCSSTTGHVIGIKLVGNRGPNDIRYLRELGNLTNLRTLNLSSNQFFKTLPSHIGSLISLSTLDLSSNQLSGSLPSEIRNLTNLRILDLSSNRFFGTLPSELGNLINLSMLDLSFNQFSGTLPSTIGNFTKLDALHLSSNKFSGIVPSQLWSLTNLKDLDLSENDFSSSAIGTLFNMSQNLVAPSLRTLNLHRNKMKRLPSCIWQFSKLEELVVSSNSLNDTITEADLAKLHNLRVLDLSFNSLTLKIRHDWTPTFQLSIIALSGCKVGPNFHLWLRTNNNFFYVDLSNNGISGEVPKWFWNLCHEVNYLNLSHNQLSGAFSDFSSINIEYIDVSTNKFLGPMPLSLLSTSTIIFQVSQNMFTGPFSLMCSVPHEYNLNVLDLSNNQLVGKLPNCWETMTDLWFINFSYNNFSGEIPHSLGRLSSLWNLHLANNNFSGELPSTLKNCTYLQLLDVGDNMLTGSIPTWIGGYHEAMLYLILRNNRFHGSIPPQICYLSNIQVLDLSGNNISGKIPLCFNNFTHFVKNISSEIIPMFSEYTYYEAVMTDYTTVLWKHMKSEYSSNLKLLRFIDLSHNRLVGKIPSSFSYLKELNSLNLSRNRLTGIIDPDIGQMHSLESLDMSSNQLSGLIPDGITQLNFLSVLDLSNNDLSGKIPAGTQLQLFTESAYVGNIGLCGSPLPPCPGDNLNPSINNEARNIDEEDDGGVLSFSFLKEFVISIILGFIIGFWGVVGPLIVKESWRRIFYNFFDSCGDWMFVNVSIFWRKLRRSL